jgi:hypothetical protein
MMNLDPLASSTVKMTSKLIWSGAAFAAAFSSLLTNILKCGSLLFFLIGFCELAIGQVVKEETRLLDKPSGVPLGTSVPSGTVTKVIERQGFWVRVDISGRTGWIKASGLSFSSGNAGPAAIDTGRLGTGNIVSTSAARGLSAKDLLNGTPRIEEVAKMIQFTPDKASLIAFGSQGNLVALAQAVSLNAAAPVFVKPVTPHADGKRNSSNENLKST